MLFLSPFIARFLPRWTVGFALLTHLLSPSSSINHGAAGGSLLPFSTISPTLSSFFSSVFNVGPPGFQWLSLGLTTVLVIAIYLRWRCFPAMNIESLPLIPVVASAASNLITESLNVEVIMIEGQEIRVHRPAEPQPQGSIPLPSHYTNGIFYIGYHSLYVYLLSFSPLKL